MVSFLKFYISKDPRGEKRNINLLKKMFRISLCNLKSKKCFAKDKQKEIEHY